MPNWGRRIVGGILGGFTGLVLAVAFSMLLQYSSRGSVPNGAFRFLLVLIYVGMYVGAFPLVTRRPEEGWFAYLIDRWGITVPFSRELLIRAAWLIAFWIGAVGLFYLVFEPQGRRMNDNEFWLMIKVMLFPVGIGIVGFVGYVKLTASNEK